MLLYKDLPLPRKRTVSIRDDDTTHICRDTTITLYPRSVNDTRYWKTQYHYFYLFYLLFIFIKLLKFFILILLFYMSRNGSKRMSLIKVENGVARESFGFSITNLP